MQVGVTVLRTLHRAFHSCIVSSCTLRIAFDMQRGKICKRSGLYTPNPSDAFEKTWPVRGENDMMVNMFKHLSSESPPGT